MSQLIGTLGAVLAKLWWWTRQVTGDAAYENYLHRSARGPGHSVRSAAPMVASAHRAHISRQEFYLDSLRRRFSGVHRCC